MPNNGEQVGRALFDVYARIERERLYSTLKSNIINNTSHLENITDMRGVGKSSTLVDLALEFDLPIITRNYFSKNHLKQIANFKFEINNLKIVSANDMGIRDRVRSPIVLVEEGFSISEINRYLKNYDKVVIGYCTDRIV